MPLRLRCSQGHVWELAATAGGTLPISDGNCPVCGLVSDHLSLESAGETWDGQRTAPYLGHAAVRPNERPAFAGYEVLAEIGRGGMGVVYRARQLSLNRIVALKVPHSTANTFARFRAEAEVVARLNHPNIVPIFDFGLADGQPFFSMEFLDGGTLADTIGNLPVPGRPAARLVATLSHAIDAANQAGVIHRDLKPANVLLAADGTPKISDFGLALATQSRLPMSGTGIEGTPSYMAPEQAAGQQDKIDARSDVYGLGAILYRLLTGRAPFDGRNVEETLSRVLHANLVPPRELQPAIPRDLEAVCLRCLAREPNRRYVTAGELADDLERFLNGDAVRARAAPPLERTVRLMRRKPARILIAGLLLAAALGGLWYWHARLRVTTAYFADRIHRWGAPVGFDPLSDEEVRHREASLRFHSRGGRVERIEVVNSRGELTTRHRFGNNISTAESFMEIGRPECQFTYTYDASGRVTSETAHDANGDVVWSFQFTSPTAGYYKDRRGYPAPQVAGGATYIEFEFNEDGRPIMERYRDASSNPKPDGLGSYGSRNEFGANARLIRQIYVDREDQAKAAFAGIAGMKIEYDSRGRLVRGEVLDTNGRRSTASTGISSIRFDNDQWGNLIRYRYFDTKDEPCLWNGDYHGFDIQHDELGRTTGLRLFDEKGQPERSRDGFAEIRAEYDNGNLPIRESYRDETGRRCRIAAGFSRIDRTYDQRGDVLDESYFDEHDQPVAGPNGFHRSVQTFHRGDRTEIRMLSPDGSPAKDKNGVSRQRFTFNDRHQVVRIENLDSDGNPLLSAEGIASWTIRYDVNGNDIEHRFLGIDGKPSRNMAWAAMEQYDYDEYGKRTVTRNLDLERRKLILRIACYAVIPGRPADRAGLRVGDVFERFQGQPVTEIEDFKSRLQRSKTSSPPFECVVRRDGQSVTLRFDEAPGGFSFGKRYVLP